jgi:uncharacterized UBP type Zn finger protein
MRLRSVSYTTSNQEISHPENNPTPPSQTTSVASSTSCRLKAEISPLPSVHFSDDEDLDTEETKYDSLSNLDPLRELVTLSSRDESRRSSVQFSMESCCSDINFRMHKGIVGLDNPDMFSYMNCVLQALISIDPMVHYYISSQYEGEFHSHKKVFSMLLSRLFKTVFSRDHGTIVPSPFWKFIAPKFPIGRMHNSVDFFNFLLKQLSVELANTNSNTISRLFRFSVKETISCRPCGFTKQISSLKYILDLELSGSLSSSLTLLSTPHKLLDHICQSCKSKSIALSHFELQDTPRYLILHIKRRLHITNFLKLPGHMDFHKNLSINS